MEVTPDRNFGLVTGVVRSNYDEKQPGKVQVEYYLGESGKMKTGWVPVMTPYVGKEAGMYFLPEVGSDVIIAFLMGRPDCPVIIGSLWSKEVKRPADAVTEKNTIKIVKTAGGHIIRFSEEEKKEKLEVITPGELQISMDDEKKTVIIQDKDKKNIITMDSENGLISIEAEKKFTIKVDSTELTMEKDKVNLKSKEITIEGDSKLTLKGKTALVDGNSTTVKASGSMELSASGTNTIKGATVKVN